MDEPVSTVKVTSWPSDLLHRPCSLSAPLIFGTSEADANAFTSILQHIFVHLILTFECCNAQTHQWTHFPVIRLQILLWKYPYEGSVKSEGGCMRVAPLCFFIHWHQFLRSSSDWLSSLRWAPLMVTPAQSAEKTPSSVKWGWMTCLNHTTLCSVRTELKILKFWIWD